MAGKHGITSIAIDQTTLQVLEHEAERLGLSRSALCRYLIRVYASRVGNVSEFVRDSEREKESKGDGENGLTRKRRIEEETREL